MEAVYSEGQRQFNFLRRLRVFNICQPLLHSVYHMVVICLMLWPAGEKGVHTAHRNRVNKLIKQVSSVLGSELEKVQQVAERRMLSKLKSVTINPAQSPHAPEVTDSSIFTQTLIAPKCKPEHLRRSFIPAATGLFNTQ